MQSKHRKKGENKKRKTSLQEGKRKSLLTLTGLLMEGPKPTRSDTKASVAYEVWWDASISKNPTVDVSGHMVFDLSSFWQRNVTFESEREHYFTLA
jgi:hypothetical protein